MSCSVFSASSTVSSPWAWVASDVVVPVNISRPTKPVCILHYYKKSQFYNPCSILTVQKLLAYQTSIKLSDEGHIIVISGTFTYAFIFLHVLSILFRNVWC
jgi:hypothetical protein